MHNVANDKAWYYGETVGCTIIMKGREPEWPNPKLNAGNSKKLKNGLKTKYPTLPNHSTFQKCEFSIAHEMHFQDWGGGELTQHLWVRPLWF